MVGFAAIAGVSLDRRDQVGGAAIVQQEDPLSQAPQRSGAELVAARAALRDIVRQARSHVMDLNIRERSHRSIAQRTVIVRHLRGADGRVVAGRAADGS